MRWLGLDRLAFALLRRLLSLLVKPTVLPQPTALGTGGPEPLCYVLERNSLSDLLTLDIVCLRQGLPRPTAPMPTLHERRSVVMLRTRPHWYSRRTVQSVRLQRMTEMAAADPALDARLVPVSVFWGRSPDRERSFFKALFSEDWAVAGRLHRLLAILFHGRNTLVQFSEPLSLRAPVDEGLEGARAARRTHRRLRVHFRQRRVAVIGPDLSHKRTLVSRIVRSAAVRHAVAREARAQELPRRKVLLRARQYAAEIAADYSYPTVRVLDRVLEWWWNQRYEGIDVHNLDRLKAVVEGNEIVYVPCHRSHVDYLLLSFVLYRAGLVIPHIAAGINLNLPVIGAILRRGGAFFMRRSFRGNRLYAAVFNEYLSQNIARGVALEYFIEGTRSRTGRLLEPKLGMLSMTLKAFLRHRRRPVVFVPVYIGYEHLFEGNSYVGELSGRQKKKESVFDLLRVLATLRGKYGRVSVSIGEPLFLDRMLDAEAPGWREREGAVLSRGNGSLEGVVPTLAQELMTRINTAAAVNPINLLALALLSTPKNAMLERDLERMLDLYAQLLRTSPYSSRVAVTSMRGSEMIAHADGMGLLRRQSHSLGDVLSLAEEDAVLLTYLRNNVLHLVAMPSLIACCFLNNRSMSVRKVVQLVRLVYPFLKSELFLRWEEHEIGDVVRSTVDCLVEMNLLARERLDTGSTELAVREGAAPQQEALMLSGTVRAAGGAGTTLGATWFERHDETAAGTAHDGGGAGDMVWRPLTGSREAVQLSVLAQGTLQTLERFYMTIALLFKHGSGALTQGELESLCQLMAQRMAMLHGLNAPEFFARPLFRNFIRRMKQRGVLREEEDGGLVFDDTIRAVEADAKLVLSEQMRHSVLQVTQM
jgi:glycerol-3-phosphate O-acyltransferase